MVIQHVSWRVLLRLEILPKMQKVKEYLYEGPRSFLERNLFYLYEGPEPRPRKGGPRRGLAQKKLKKEAKKQKGPRRDPRPRKGKSLEKVVVVELW